MSDDTTNTQETPQPPATPTTPVPAATGAQATTPAGSMSERTAPDRSQELKKAASQAGKDGSRTSVMRYMQQKRCGAD
ncbi:MAG: hypothetical protein K2W85_01325 [Phycisphaerales bacterium]|nr:hypothetical protein [Phycisphaerales bacterium]